MDDPMDERNADVEWQIMYDILFKFFFEQLHNTCWLMYVEIL